MEIRIGGNMLASNTLCYKVSNATFSRWISCSKPIAGQYIWITMPVVGKKLLLIEVMAYELHFVQQSVISVWMESSYTKTNAVPGSSLKSWL